MKVGAPLKTLARILIHGRAGDLSDTRGRRVLRWIRIGVLIPTGLVTLQSVLLVAGAWRNGLAIQRNMGVAEAMALNTGMPALTIEFVTLDRVIYRPELGGLTLAEKRDVSPKNGSLWATLRPVPTGFAPPRAATPSQHLDRDNLVHRKRHCRLLRFLRPFETTRHHR